MLTSRKILGLAASQYAITAVEVATSRGHHRLVHSAELPLSDPAILQEPAKLGPALRDMLRRNHFSASRCVIGLQASHLAAKDKSLPAAARESLRDILAIAAEQEFATSAQDVTVDYLPSSDGQAVGALLVAAPRRLVESLVATARAAGLSVRGVTASCLALAQAGAGGGAGDRMTLWLSRDGAELVVTSQGRPRLLRWLPVHMEAASEGGDSAERYIAQLRAELKRVLAMGMGQGRSGKPTVRVWNATGLDDSSVAALGEGLALSVHLCKYPRDLDALEGSPPQGSAAQASAAALAIGAAPGQARGVDFLRSRLAPRGRRRFGRASYWAAAVALVAIAAVASLILDWRSSRNEIADLRDRLTAITPSVERARELVERASFARGWYDRRPRFLDCLREVTLAFPEEGRVWATNLAIREDMHVLLSGKAVNEAAVLEVLDRIKSNPRLADVKPTYIRQVGTNRREVSFAVGFTFVGAK